MLAVHLALAVGSLVRENPTVDEVVHLPAGLTYWQKGTFKLYHHGPRPLVKLVAALVLLGADTSLINRLPAWKLDAPSPAVFAQAFQVLNAPRYFELFTRARLSNT